MPVTYTHSAIVVTPHPEREEQRERVPVRFTGSCWTDWKRRRYCPETGRRLSAPYTNGARLLFDTLRDRSSAGV